MLVLGEPLAWPPKGAQGMSRRSWVEVVEGVVGLRMRKGRISQGMMRKGVEEAAAR